MTRFEYLAIFYGIVVGLALENVASSFHRLLAAGKRVRWHWMAPTNAIGSATATLGQFWLWWVARDMKIPNPRFVTFLPGAVTAILLYLVCAATLPDDVPAEGIDLREFYFSTRRQFWSLVAAVGLIGMIGEIWALARTGFDPRFVVFHTPILIGSLVVAMLAASLIYVRASWWHAVGIVAITTATFLFYGPMNL